MRQSGIQYTLETPRGDLTLNPTGMTGDGFYLLPDGMHFQSAVRDSIEGRPQVHGSYVDPSYKDGITGTIEGVIIASTAASRQALEDELLSKVDSLLAGGGTLTWTPQDGTSEDRQLSDLTQMEPVVFKRLGGTHKSFTFALASPRASAQSEATTTVDTTEIVGGESGGITFDLSFDINFWLSSTSGGEATVTNDGTTTAYPILQIHGPINSAIVNNETDDKALLFDGSVSAGDYLEIDLFARTVMLNGTVNNFNLLEIPESEWFGFEPGDTDLQLTGTDTDANTLLRVLMRSAYV